MAGLGCEPVHTLMAGLGCEPVHTLMVGLGCEPVHTVVCGLWRKKLRCGPVDTVGLRSEPVHTMRAELGCEPVHTVICGLLRKKLRCKSVDTMGLRSEAVHTMWSVRKKLKCEPVHTVTSVMKIKPRVQLAINCLVIRLIQEQRSAVPSYFLGTGIPRQGDIRDTALCSSDIQCHVTTDGWPIFLYVVVYTPRSGASPSILCQYLALK
jgi:hypothetical protein